MKAKAQLTGYEGIEFSITLTAPVEDWRAVLRQLDKTTEGGWIAWPLSGFANAVRETLKNLDKTHYAAIEKDEQPQEINACI